jgi:succinoglycan biosynthesis transport protein ExoP
MSKSERQQPSFVPANQMAQTIGPTEEVGYYYADQAQDKHLRDYWNILRKRMRHMVLIFCGALALGLIFILSSPTLYTAKSTLKIELQSPSVTGVGGVGETRQEAGGPYDFYQTQYMLLKSRPLAARVVKKLGLESNTAFTSRQGLDAFTAALGWITSSIGNFIDWTAKLLKGEEPREPRPANYELGVAPRFVGQYLTYLEVTPVRNTRLVDISFSTPSAKLSQELANAHATGFIQMTLEDRFNLTQEARDFLAKKLAELRQKVVIAETEMNQFRQKHGVVSLEKGENIVVDRLVDLNKELTRIRAQRIEAESLYQMTRNRNTQYLAEVLNNPLTTQLRGNIANLETEKGRLLSIYTEDHPRIQELNQQIGEARKALNGEINNVVRGIESSYSAARAREDALEAEGKRQQDLALGLKQVGVDYAVLNEEVTVSRGLYESVLKRLNETNVGNDLAAANIAIMQRAEMPAMPSSPRTLLILVVSAILGLLLAVGYAFFTEYMDAAMNTPQGVWAAVSLATLGVVPQLGSLHRRYRLMLPHYAKKKSLEPPKKPDESLSKELVVVRNQVSMIAESYRTIRTALLLSQAEHPPKVIVLTSPSPGDGKTMTTLNLATALAQSGQRVLVIDADMRKGRCHKLVNVENHHGLANLLTGHASLQESIQQTTIGNLYLLPRGALPPNPADLLMSPKMRDVLRELRESFDFIVIDSPPVIAVSDATILSALCDGVLLVLHGQKTTTPKARRAVDRLESIGAPILGVILNGVDMRNPDYVDYSTYYGAYHPAVEEEESVSGNGKADAMIRNVEDVDSLVENAGFRVMGSIPSVDLDGKKPIATTDRRTLPQPFFDRMVCELNEALGPTAASVLQKQVALLRESMDAFPLSRARELMQRVSQEIVGTRVKARFLHAMSEELRNCEQSGPGPTA